MLMLLFQLISILLFIIILCNPQKRMYSAQSKQQKLQLNKTCVNHTKQSLNQVDCA